MGSAFHVSIHLKVVLKHTHAHTNIERTHNHVQHTRLYSSADKR